MKAKSLRTLINIQSNSRIFFLGATVIVIFLFSPFGGTKGYSQDIHFSQFYQAPLQVNPSLTGVFNGDVRACVNYKDQWGSINKNAGSYITTSSNSTATFRTYGFAFDAGLFKKKWQNSYLGAGLFVYSDKAGDAKMGTTKADISLSSILLVAEGHMVTMGIQGGYGQRNVDVNNPNLRWESQYQNETYNKNLASGETVAYEPFGFADFSLGASWNYGSDESAIFKNNKFRANAGVAYHHLNRPKQQFNMAEKLNAKMVAHGGLYLGMSNSNMALLPSVIYFQQGNLRETNFGALIRYTLVESSKYTGIMKESALYLGGYYRLGDAFIPSMMIDFSNFNLGLTYDINVSKLKTATNAKGGLEISLRFISPNPFNYKYGKARSKSVRFL